MAGGSTTTFPPAFQHSGPEITGNQKGPRVMTSRLSRRRLASLITLPVAGVALARSGLLAQGDQVIDPEATPGGTPASLCLPATPDGATPVDGSDCLRGAIPFTLRIEAIGVDAPFEILETVGGVMQQPSDEAHVAWYKESARLGETGNILVAGHVNWWNVPEAVFFNLGTLQPGDVVEILDEQGTSYQYEIEWVRQESNLEPPREEVLGMTNYEAVTMMTCSGEWNSEISEYDARTVARARRTMAIPEGNSTPAA
jgi:sortase (surface protein transpeptidase)